RVGAVPVVPDGHAGEIERPEPPESGNVDVAGDDGKALELSGSGTIAHPGDLEGSHPPRDVRDDTGMAGGADDQEPLRSTAHHDHGSLPRKTGTDALPSGVMPRRRATLVKVLRRIWMSTASDTFSTYQRSQSNFCSHVSAFRPLTCAQPVMPGSTSWRRAWRGEYRSRYSTSNGLGPTRLIWPLSTFHSCGSSSRLNVRSTRPNAVSRSASGLSSPTLSRSDVIVRNL